MEIEAYNQSLDQYYRDQAAELIRIQNEKEGQLGEKESEDLEAGIGATQRAAFSSKGVAYDVATGLYKSDKILEAATFGGLLGSKDEIKARRRRYTTKKTTGAPLTKAQSIYSTIPEPPDTPIPETIQQRRLPTATQRAIQREIRPRRVPTATLNGLSVIEAEPGIVSRNVSKLGGEGARVGKAGKSITGKVLNTSGDILKAGKIGTTSLIRHSGAVMNIGFGAEALIEDIAAGEVVGENTGEQVSNVLQVGSGIAELGSLGAGALIGAGVLGAAAAPVVIGLGVLGAGLGVASAISEAVGVIDESQEEQEKIKGEEQSELSSVQQDIAKMKKDKPFKDIGSAGVIEGSIAPKLLG
jgi:hypothetical protein